MPLRAWNKIEFYDMGAGGPAVRYSGFSGHGEYWIARPAPPAGKSRRAQRDWVLTLIAEAIEADDKARAEDQPVVGPGEVAYREPPPEIF